MSKLTHNKYFHAGLALWKQRAVIAKSKKQLEDLAKAINRIGDSGISQYVQLYAMVLEFKPTVIVEIGRGYGNSTAVFTDSANLLPQTRKVISICLSSNWQTEVIPRLSQIVSKNWFDKLDTYTENIVDIDLKKFINKNDRILFFWDAHGFTVGEHILSNILPLLQKNKHLILVHDILDVRYHLHLKNYKGAGVWNGYQDQNENNKFLIINSMASAFEEIIMLNDFLERNNIKIHSVEHEIRSYIINKKNRASEIDNYLGSEMSLPTTSLYWFSLNENRNQNKLVFPKIRSNIKLSSNKKIRLLSNQPLVSIITTCYNSADYISECIESVVSQDYPNIEHVIQDGGSEDQTLKIIKNYQRRYKNKIALKSEKDNGQSDGLDKALKRAKGEIILVLNSDDMLLPYACSWGVTNMKIYKDAAVIYGDEYIIDEKSKIIHFFTGPDPYDFEKIFCVEQVIPAQAAFIKRDSLEDAGLYADTSLKTCPDYEMWVRLGIKYKMKHIYGPIAKYRWHIKSEGRKPEMIDEMVKAKRQVMDRIFSDHKTPQKIKKLKLRSYAGVEEWASQVAATLGDRKRVFSYLLKSTLTYPRFNKILRLFYITIKYTKIIIMGIR